MKYRSLLRISVLIVLLFALSLTAMADSYDDLTDLVSDTNDDAWEVLLLTNRERIAQGLLPLSTFSPLQAAGNVRVEEIKEVFSHSRPDNSSCFTALNEQNLSYSSAGENIAMGQQSPAAVVEAWMNSPGHRANILTSRFVHAGMGASQNHWVQMFLDSYCSFSGLEVLSPAGGFQLNANQTIDDLGGVVKLTCSVHGDCYLPLMQELCTYSNADSSGITPVTVRYNNLSATFQLTHTGELSGGSYTEGDFTVRVEKGKAYITRWSGSGYSYTDLVIPETLCGYPVVGIDDAVFSEKNFSSVTLPDTLQQIGHEAFYASSIPGEVHIPASVTSIGMYAFSYCWDLKAIHVDPANPAYSSVDGVLYDKNQTVLYNYPCGKPDASYTVPATVQKLYCTSFAQSQALKDLYVPSPRISAMTYTFYYSNTNVHCHPDTTLYTQILRSQIYPPLGELKPLETREVTVSEDGIHVRVTGNFTDGNYFLVAFDSRGKLLSTEVLSGLYAHSLEFSKETTTLKLFALDHQFAPKQAAELFWSSP